MNSKQKKKQNRKPFFAKWANVPFAPAKWPFFYGWMIVAVATLSIVCSVPGQTAGVGVFTNHIIDTLGMTRDELSLAYMVGTLTSGFILPFSGRLLDIIGVRLMSLCVSVGLAVSLLILSQVDRLAEMLKAFFHSVSAGIPGIETLAEVLSRFFPSGLSVGAAAALAFLLIRFFGQGNMTTVGRVAMGRWFNRHRGMATAISGVPVTFVFNAAPWLLTGLISAVGWRQACRLMAGIVGIGMAAIGVLFFRDNPEECGLTMDGTPQTAEAQQKHPDLHPIYRDFTRREALGSLAFWTITLILSLHSMIITAVAFHITDFGADMGKTSAEATRLFLYFVFITLPVRFATAYVMDRTRIPVAWILATVSATMAGGLAGLIFFDTAPGFILTILMLGLSGGIWGVLVDASLPRFFGRKHLGAISGTVMSAMVLSSAMGPVLFSYGKTYLGSYRAMLIWLLILPIVIFAMSLFARNPQNRYKPA